MNAKKQTVLANLTAKQLEARKRALTRVDARIEAANSLSEIDAYLLKALRPILNPVLK